MFRALAEAPDADLAGLCAALGVKTVTQPFGVLALLSQIEDLWQYVLQAESPP